MCVFMLRHVCHAYSWPPDARLSWVSLKAKYKSHTVHSHHKTLIKLHTGHILKECFDVLKILFTSLLRVVRRLTPILCFSLNLTSWNLQTAQQAHGDDKTNTIHATYLCINMLIQIEHIKKYSTFLCADIGRHGVNLNNAQALSLREPHVSRGDTNIQQHKHRTDSQQQVGQRKHRIDNVNTETLTW